MENIISGYIEDSLEDVLQPLISTPEYKQKQEELNKELEIIRASLPAEAQVRLNKYLSNMGTMYCEQTVFCYKAGITQGVLLRKEVSAK